MALARASNWWRSTVTDWTSSDPESGTMATVAGRPDSMSSWTRRMWATGRSATRPLPVRSTRTWWSTTVNRPSLVSTTCADPAGDTYGGAGARFSSTTGHIVRRRPRTARAIERCSVTRILQRREAIDTRARALPRHVDPRSRTL